MFNPISSVLFVAMMSTATPAAHQTVTTEQPKSVQTTAPPSQRQPAQLVNVKVDLTISDQREGVNTAPKVITLVVSDRESGRIRTGTGDLMLNVDARPEIVRDGKIRLHLNLEYRPQRAESEKNMVMTITESLAAILDDGKALVVSQSADPASNRTVKVEVRASVQK